MKNEIFLICHSALIWSQPVLSNRNLLASSPNDINWVGVQSINITCENNPVREGCSAGNIRIKTFKCTDREANNSIYAVNAEQHIKQISSDGSGLFMFKEDQKQNFQSCTTSKCSRKHYNLHYWYIYFSAFPSAAWSFTAALWSTGNCCGPSQEKYQVLYGVTPPM